MPQITVLIATSYKRSNWLINRSLLSIYNQKEVEPKSVNVLIVDDNVELEEFDKIQELIQQLRQSLNLPISHFKTSIIRNIRTRFNSGTGAWNTGIFETYKKYKNGFISILDDDDEYLNNHLSSCISSINENTLAVFQSLEWKNEDNSILEFPLCSSQLTPEHFFIGNPGIQGSNMFIKTEALIVINGFDEALPNTTDRDLMIRFLRKNKTNQVKVLKIVGVIHYNHKQIKVNSNISLKQQGLDLFYQKHMANFSKEAYQKSLTRAKKYFSYSPNEEK